MVKTVFLLEYGADRKMLRKAAARSSGDGCRPSSCEATEAFRRGLEARFVTGTLTERAPAGPGELASILRMRAVLDEPPDAWDALCGEECTIEW